MKFLFVNYKFIVHGTTNTILFVVFEIFLLFNSAWCILLYKILYQFLSLKLKFLNEITFMIIRFVR